jgi:hypothetical protein
VVNNKLCEASGSNNGVTEDSDLLDVTPCGRFGVSYDPQPASGEASRKNTNSLRFFETSGNTNRATEYHIAEDQNLIIHTTLLVDVTGIHFVSVIWFLKSSIPVSRKIRFEAPDIPHFSSYDNAKILSMSKTILILMVGENIYGTRQLSSRQ